jgi:hypothetical protein
MNTSIPKKFLNQERARDPEMFCREYGAEFTDSISAFFSRDSVESCMIQGRHELPPMLSEYCYSAGVDPSGGGPDEFTMAICHREEDHIVQDVVRGWIGDRPNDVVKEASALLKQYRIRQITGDKYAGEWPKQSFADQGIEYRFSDKTASPTSSVFWARQGDLG